MWYQGLRSQPYVAQAIWIVLVLAIALALIEARWSLAFISAATLALSLAPILVQRRLGIRMPVHFLAGTVVFVFATIFLGEAFDFYNRYWWWDVVLHAGSALGFGLAGFLFVFMLFEGDRYAAPAGAVASLGFCLALSIGTLWEVFEFAMDQIFGLNMQKSGLLDTMSDLIVDTIGAGVGAVAGYFYLKGRQIGGLTGVLHEFVQANRRLFRKYRR